MVWNVRIMFTKSHLPSFLHHVRNFMRWSSRIVYSCSSSRRTHQLCPTLCLYRVSVVQSHVLHGVLFLGKPIRIPIICTNRMFNRYIAVSG